MSFFTDILNVGKNLIGGISGFLGGSSVLGNVAKTAMLSYLVNKTNNSVSKSNASKINTLPPPIDQGVRIQLPPNSNEKIPVLYGTAYFGGIITEAKLTADQKTMWYVVTLCEKTGTLLSTGGASSYTFKDVYWNDQRVVFESTGSLAGLRAEYSVDRDGNRDYSIDGLLTVYPFAGSSTAPTYFENYTNGASLDNAYDLVPGWNSNYQMNNLVFAVVRVDYNAEKNVNSLGNLIFQIENSMTQPGDVLNDYMTNTRYGAGIPAEDVFDE